MAEDINASQGQTPSEWRWASALDREIGGPTSATFGAKRQDWANDRRSDEFLPISVLDSAGRRQAVLLPHVREKVSAKLTDEGGCLRLSGCWR